mmetsp:Transcript_52058/g.103397  ORF Transcript_52058/g.103397 Transcript_52058/m.103397 type:complete len:215 (-) Transcript_52058:410-1054(-)
MSPALCSGVTVSLFLSRRSTPQGSDGPAASSGPGAIGGCLPELGFCCRASCWYAASRHESLCSIMLFTSANLSCISTSNLACISILTYSRASSSSCVDTRERKSLNPLVIGTALLLPLPGDCSSSFSSKFRILRPHFDSCGCPLMSAALALATVENAGNGSLRDADSDVLLSLSLPLWLFLPTPFSSSALLPLLAKPSLSFPSSLFSAAHSPSV